MVNVRIHLFIPTNQIEEPLNKVLSSEKENLDFRPEKGEGSRNEDINELR